MPEIKKNFIQGKMNKDLDERLVPNGQYRDAMNVQISTSQGGQVAGASSGAESTAGSEIGTVQNLLGNSLVPGQEFIADNASCVGSISDEKNDRLYWFITNGTIELTNEYFNTERGTIEEAGTLKNWKTLGSLSGTIGLNNTPLVTTQNATSNSWSYSDTNNSITANDIEDEDLVYEVSMDIKPDRTYIIKVETVFSSSGNGTLLPVLIDNHGKWTKPAKRYAADGSTSWTTWTLRTGLNDDTQESDTSNGRHKPGILYFTNPEDTSHGNRLNCEIQRVKVEEVSSSCIVEYDTVRNTVVPVFIDRDNTVLKLDPNRIITGINIIDDFLLWTDNNSEPKKINIIDSKEGTRGLSHTKVVNPAQDLGTKTGDKQVDVTEQDIAIIKKPPSHPLALYPEIIRKAEDENDKEIIYTGVIRTSDTKIHPNSFIGSSIGEIHDFAFLEVGDTFRVNIETDINGNNDFELKRWRENAPVAIKEFRNNLPPQIPIGTNYTIKGTITDWPHNKFTNANLPLLENPDLLEIDSNGEPVGWNVWGNWTFDQTNKLFDAGGSLESGDHDKLFVQFDTILPEGIEADKEYRIRYRVSKNLNDDPLTGSVRVMLFDNDGTVGANGGGHWAYLGRPDSTGVYEHHHVFKTIDDSGTGDVGNRGVWSHTNSYLNALVFEQLPIEGNPVTYYHPWPELGDATEMIELGWQGPAQQGTAGPELLIATMSPGARNTSTFTIGSNQQELIVDTSQINATELATQGSTDRVILNNLHSINLITDEHYELTTTMTGFTGTGWIGISSGGIAAQDPVSANTHGHRHGTSGQILSTEHGQVVDANGDSTFTSIIRAATDSKIDIVAFGGAQILTNQPSGTITVSLKRIRSEVFNGTISDVVVEEVDAVEQARVEIRIDAIDDELPVIPINSSELKYAIDFMENEEHRLFENKFPRFAYRYKYIDGEYSAISPFTQPAFYPGTFNFHPQRGYNLGMINSLKRLIIRGYNRMLPSTVKSVDLLYKEENSTNIYIVETIKNLKKSAYELEGETIVNGLVDSAQLLRLWDNVPKKALAQDIVGNRIVYGNYVQNYNLIDNITLKDFQLDLSVKAKGHKHGSSTGKKSIKSLREYQIGVVYTDAYGRETPILTSPDAIIKVPKHKSASKTHFEVEIKNQGHPVNMKYWKFYIKDTGGDYHNLAMDRYYDAEDDNIWLAFPSSDRSKIEIDDYIVLKKAIGLQSDFSESILSQIKSAPKHKVLDIKNEAPDYIRRKETRIASVRHHNTHKKIFRDGGIPAEGDISFSIEHQFLSSASYGNLHLDFGKDPKIDYYISFHADYNDLVTDRYKIKELHGDTEGSEPIWYFTLEKPLTSEINDFTNDETGNASTKIKDKTYLACKYKNSLIIGKNINY